MPRKTVKVTLGIHIGDGGDGSVSATLYTTQALAEQALENEFEVCGEAYMDGGATSATIEIDPKTGEIVGGALTEAETFEY
jgi:hypothetical protein